MSTALECSSCHAPLPAGVSDGLCPSCVSGLLAAGRRRRVRGKAKWPRRFGGYELLDKLGRGGMGIVYKARQRKLDRVVALKMIRSEHLCGAGGVERFRSETEAVARLDHPHIIPLYEVGERGGRNFFSMLLVESGSLVTHLPRLKRDQRKSAQIMATVARAVHHAHQHGILHRDLKPANILLDAEDQPYVSDFGLAKHVDDQGALTRTGVVLGTPNYMAPEQAAGKDGRASPAADVYSLGAILYELLTGQPPFAAESPVATLRQVQEQEPRRPSELNPRVDRDLETICLKCLEKDPKGRYPTAEGMALDLERYLRHDPINARPIGAFGELAKWARRNPLASCAAIAAVGLLTLAFVSLFFALHVRSGLLPQPNVVVMDTPAPDGKYPGVAPDQTNADVLINSVLRDLPINRLKESLDKDWGREEHVINVMRPDIILIHKSAFFHARNAEPKFKKDTPEWDALYKASDDKLITLLGYIGKDRPNARFVIYSRGTDGWWPDDVRRENWVRGIETRYPTLRGRIHTFYVEGGVATGTFSNGVNPERIRSLVKDVMQKLNNE